MSLNFAPYATPSASPHTPGKGKAPADTSSAVTNNPFANSDSYHAGAPVSSLDPSKAASSSAHERGFEQSHVSLPTDPYDPDMYSTRFGWRHDVVGAACYVTGPFLAFIILIFETRNDWIRFHGFQSLLLSAAALVAHFFLLWSSFLSWILFMVDIVCFGWLAFTAYHDAEVLTRWKVPILGDIAERWVEEE